MSSYRNVLLPNCPVTEMSVTEMSITKVSFTKMSWIPGRYTGRTSIMYMWRWCTYNIRQQCTLDILPMCIPDNAGVSTERQHDRCTSLTLKPAPHHPCSCDNYDSSISIATPHQPINPYVVSRIVRQGPVMCPALFNTLHVTNGYISR